MSRDISIRATRRRLEDLGYAITSATHPDRIVSRSFRYEGMATFSYLSDHPAAILTLPTPANSPELKERDELENRRIVLLVLTAYLQSDSKQLKAVSAVLERHKLTSGPCHIDDFGNRSYLLRYNGRENLGDVGARMAFPDDDSTVLFKGADVNKQFEGCRVGEHGVWQQIPKGVDRSYIVPLEGDWKQAHILDTPRRNLPELFRDDVSEIIADCERARWGARPAASAKEAA